MAPIKVTTIPWLELAVAVVSAIQSTNLKEVLGSTDVVEYFWTDSKVILGYINNDAHHSQTFVSNQMQKNQSQLLSSAMEIYLNQGQP